MLTPSYSSLITILNEDNVDKKITSRYSIVTATARRARQIVAGADYEDMGINSDKAVSIAVNELYNGYVRIVPKEGAEAWDEYVPPIQPSHALIDDSFVMNNDEEQDYEDDDLEGLENEEIHEDWDDDLDEDDPEEDDLDDLDEQDHIDDDEQ
jgi:DNA-directed RNA polymerase subunit omega